MKLLIAIALLAALALSGCAMMDRSRDYASVQEDEYAAYAAQKSGTAEALDELGWSPSRQLTSEEEEVLQKRVKLKRLEHDNLTSDRERTQYFTLRPNLADDDERINFLSLPNYEARERYALQKGISSRAPAMVPEVRDAVSKSDIILGMNKEAVVDSWGEPADVEVAGNRIYGNEKWTYIQYVPTPDGYDREERVVIFEAGRVVGWQRN
jgi:outer membrane protein assembly factor BamE (lipoprotein component of BamABCDE complex)